MGGKIKLTPDTVREAGKKISQISYTPTAFEESALSATGGLVSFRLKSMMDDLNAIGNQLTQILQLSEGKFEKIAEEMEAADQHAASQYRG